MIELLCRGPGGEYHGEHKPTRMRESRDLGDRERECPACGTVVEVP